MATARSTRKFQLGPEVTPGTPVAATAVWRGPVAGFKDTRKIERVAEDIGLLPPTNRSLTYFVGGELALPSQPATFKGLAYVGSSSIKNTTTGVADGAGSGRIYAFDEPLAGTKNTITTRTLQAGDGQQAEVGEYGFVEEWEISGAKDGAVMLNGCKWRVRQVANQAFTGGLTALAANAIPFQKSLLYIDNTGGTLGTTQKTSTLTRFSLKKSGGWKPIPTGGDGNLYYPSIDYTDPKYALDLTFLHDTHSVAQKTNWRAETAALIRIECRGAAMTTPGTAYSFETLRLDIAGKWTEFDVIGEQDGFEICTGKFEAMLDSAASLFFTMTVVLDGVATLV